MTHPSDLVELIGKHILDAVDFDSTQFKEYEEYQDCSVCRFRLNGTVYVAMEDPSDGYRSCMRPLSVGRRVKMKNVFPPIEVVGVHRSQAEYGETSDILELIDIHTGKVVLEVGTRNTSDYYPSYVANFQPENMTTNAALTALSQSTGE